MRRALQITLAVALLVGLGVVAWFLISFIASALADTSDATRNLVLTAVVGLLAWAGTRITKAIDDAKSAHRERKVEVYSQFINVTLSFIQAHTTGEDKDNGEDQGTDDLIKALRQFQKDLILWGSPGVIKAYTHAISQAGQGGIASMLSMDEVMKEMRRDLGLSNSGLGEGGLVKVLLRDPHELDIAIAALKKTQGSANYRRT